MPIEYYQDPPASEEILNHIKELINENSFSGKNLTFFSFKGSGILSLIKFTVDSLKENSEHLFSLIDLSAGIQQINLTEAVSFLRSRYKDQLNPKLIQEIDVLMNSGIVNNYAMTGLIHKITYDYGHTLTFIIDEAGILYSPKYQKFMLDKQLEALRTINPMKVNFIFLAESGFSDLATLNAGSATNLLKENIVWGDDVLFDTKSAERLITNQEKWNDYTFSLKFKTKTKKVSKGDPSVLKFIVQSALFNKAFEDKFSQEQDISKDYQLLNENSWIDSRYARIIRNLDEASLAFLSGKSEEISVFLEKTALYKNAQPVNHLFDQYLKKNGQKLNEISSGDISDALSTHFDVEEQLTGNELLIYRVLLDRKGQIVTRDQIAEVMWGSEWNDKYSDWAIDKVISRIRHKTTGTTNDGVLRVVKGQGFMLV